jgi:transcriptional regulator with XRE-family HTH domain
LGPAELGAQLGVNHQQMQKYESGRIRISVARLYQIAHALRVPIGFFLDEAAAASFVTTGTPRNCEAVIRRSPGYSGDTDLEAPQSPSKILRFAEFLQLHFREGPHAQEAAMLVTIMLIGGLSGASKESSFADFVSFVLKNDLAEYLNAIMKRGSRLPVVAHAWLVDYQSWPAAKKTAIIAAATNGLTALQTLIELLNTKWALRH